MLCQKTMFNFCPKVTSCIDKDKKGMWLGNPGAYPGFLERAIICVMVWGSLC